MRLAVFGCVACILQCSSAFDCACAGMLTHCFAWSWLVASACAQLCLVATSGAWFLASNRHSWWHSVRLSRALVELGCGCLVGSLMIRFTKKGFLRSFK